MEAFSALLAIWRVSPPVTGASDAEFDVFFDLCMNKRLSKQSRRWWLESHRTHYDVIVLKNQAHLWI